MNPRGGGSVESQGIDFILRFRDQGSQLMSKASKAYDNLVESMQRVIKVENAMTTHSVSSMQKITNASGGSQLNPIVSPLTVSEKQIQLLPKFEQVSLG